MSLASSRLINFLIKIARLKCYIKLQTSLMLSFFRLSFLLKYHSDIMNLAGKKNLDIWTFPTVTIECHYSALFN
jgi:hypothetical protein